MIPKEQTRPSPQQKKKKQEKKTRDKTKRDCRCRKTRSQRSRRSPLTHDDTALGTPARRAVAPTAATPGSCVSSRPVHRPGPLLFRFMADPLTSRSPPTAACPLLSSKTKGFAVDTRLIVLAVVACVKMVLSLRPFVHLSSSADRLTGRGFPPVFALSLPRLAASLARENQAENAIGGISI